MLSDSEVPGFGEEAGEELNAHEVAFLCEGMAELSMEHNVTISAVGMDTGSTTGSSRVSGASFPSRHPLSVAPGEVSP